MTFGERRFAATCALALCFVATGAHASNATDVATARELYKDGADALDSGKAAIAVQKLAQAWSLVQTPVIGTDLARAQRALGHLVEAREAALAVQRLPAAPDETARSTQARTEAEKIATELAPRIPHVKLVVDGVGDNHKATVKLDGAVVPEGALAVARQANPGTHAATLDTDDGRHAEGSVTLVEGETKELALVVTKATEPAVVESTPKIVIDAHPAQTQPVSQVLTTPAPTHSSVSPVLWVGVVAVGVGLVAGAITGALAMNEASIVTSQCTNFVCGPANTGDLDAANTYATVSTIGFITLGVGAALIVTGLIIGGGKHSATTHAHVAPFLRGIGGVF